MWIIEILKIIAIFSPVFHDVSKESLHVNNYYISSENNETIPFHQNDLITIHDLYNLINDGSMKMYLHDPFNLLIIDTRDENDFSTDHIITAKHYKVTLNSSFTLRLSNYGMVIIYGGELINGSVNTNRLLKLRDQIQEYIAANVLVLQDGFKTFQKNYPFLCTDKEIETIADRKELLCFPSMVIDNQLYQGRGDQATNKSVIDFLKISHIVNISLEHRNAFPEKVKYMKLALDDVSQTNLFEHFHETSEFINAALTKGGHVLVHCNLGVSRSSTITLAYLIKYKKWNLEHAFKVVRGRRSCAHPNDGFLKQLSDWEEEMLGRKLTNIDKLL